VQAQAGRKIIAKRAEMTKQSIDVSILIITYNQRKYIRKAVESVLAQKTNFRWEVLIGDDASTDGTREILYEYQKDERVMIFDRKENIGATRNLYDLQKRAQGKYLAYLEGDDYWCDDTKLQSQVDFLKSHSEYIACTHPSRLVDDKGRMLQNQYLEWISPKKNFTIRDFRGIILPGHMSSLVHRNIFYNSKESYEEIITMDPLIGDRSLCLLLVAQGNVRQLDAVMSCYRYVHKDDEENATEVVYARNHNHTLDDYIYTCKLEDYARNKLQVDGGFMHHKKELFVSAVYNRMVNPSEENKMLVKKMLSEEKCMSYILYFPIGTVIKIIKRTKNRLRRKAVDGGGEKLVKNIAMIIAGGVGARMRQDVPKQFLSVNDKPIIVYTLEAFQRHPEIDVIAVVCLEGWERTLEAYANQFNIDKLKHIIAGGENGQASIRNGVYELEKYYHGDDLVLVHDAIRPMVSEEIISDCIHKTLEYGSGIASIPCAEAMVVTATGTEAAEVYDRNHLKRTQTPQGFPIQRLADAHREALKRGITNSVASVTLMLELGQEVKLSLGSEKNLKLTTVEDIDIFKALLLSKRSEWLKDGRNL
jgi:2-C-methyl-D-erythritol 4-phosphate cytidylyltransferase